MTSHLKPAKSATNLYSIRASNEQEFLMSPSWENRTAESLENAFLESFERLVHASRAFDNGHLSQSPDIAKEVMNFCYNPGKNPDSMLTLLNFRDTMGFCDTSYQRSSVVPPGSRLMSNEYNLIDACITFSGLDYRPHFDTKNSNTIVPFENWWTGVVLSRYDPEIDGRETITRFELIQHIRNEEGGGHVSARHKRGTPSDKLVRLMQGEYVDGYMELNGGPPVTAYDSAPAYATVRQIGWELELSLRRHLPNLTNKAVTTPTKGPRMRPAPTNRL